MTESGIAYAHFDGGAKEIDAPPLLFIHGAGGTMLNWPPEIRRMKGMDVYGLDLPGHGESGGPGENSIRGFAERLLEWMDSLDLEQAIVCGQSMGGAIAMTMGAVGPRSCRRFAADKHRSKASGSPRNSCHHLKSRPISRSCRSCYEVVI